MSRRQRKGGAALEFALWLPVILSMIAGIVDVSWMVHNYHNVVRSARDGARVGVAVIEDDDVVAGSEVTDTAEAHAKAILAGVRMPCDAGCTVEASFVEEDGLEFLQVDVAYDFEPLIDFVPLKTTLRSRFVMLLQQQIDD